MWYTKMHLITQEVHSYICLMCVLGIPQLIALLSYQKNLANVTQEYSLSEVLMSCWKDRDCPCALEIA